MQSGGGVKFTPEPQPSPHLQCIREHSVIHLNLRCNDVIVGASCLALLFVTDSERLCTTSVELEEKEFFKGLFAKINMDPNEDKTPSSELSDRSRLTDPGPPPILPPKPRPQISLKIPLQPTGSIPLQTSPPRPMSFYYDPRMVAIPMTPVGNHNSNHNSNEIPAIPIPLGLMQAYPNKASEFMFKQFEGKHILL
ncbi:hypothetical protein J6590_062887 [Homalodisca vitripennis]|nr:hypothetical protein J6590_062887 [Homalodisca vitripennis]